MRIINNTQYDTKDLKRLFLACCRKVGTGKKIRKRIRVIVIDNKKELSRASYFGDWAKINLGTRNVLGAERNSKLWWREIAWITCHEFLHSKGIKHRRMGVRDKYKYYSKWSELKNNLEKMSWVDDYEIRIKTTKPKVKPDLQLVRYNKVLIKVREYTSKVKRYQKTLKRYLAKQKRYEKILTASGKIKN